MDEPSLLPLLAAPPDRIEPWQRRYFVRPRKYLRAIEVRQGEGGKDGGAESFVSRRARAPATNLRGAGRRRGDRSARHARELERLGANCFAFTSAGARAPAEPWRPRLH